MACSSPPSRPVDDLVGRSFPEVVATSLAGEDVRLPDDLRGRPAVLLVGYVMESQFDCDRWLLGLLQAQTPAQVREVPTIDGMIPGLFAGTIDEGMREGIPEEDWGSVLTLYGDAEKVTELTGKRSPRNARVFVLDPEGKIVWFHDRGYSAGHLIEVDRLCRELSN